MIWSERIQQLKNNLKNKHLSFYVNENNNLKRYDINSNKEWINANVSQDWKDCEDNLYVIKGFDFVSMSLVEIKSSEIIWDQLSKFYDTCTDYLKEKINICENTLNLISDSWWSTQNNKKLPRKEYIPHYKIYKKSKNRKDSSYYSFELKGIHYPDRFFKFDDEIDGISYTILIPSKYIAEHCQIYTKRNFGTIHKKYILDYIEARSNKQI